MPVIHPDEKKVMEIDFRVTIQGVRFYFHKSWFFRLFRYAHVWGFKIRLFGMDINIREGNATEKLIKIHLEQEKIKR